MQIKHKSILTAKHQETIAQTQMQGEYKRKEPSTTTDVGRIQKSRNKAQTNDQREGKGRGKGVERQGGKTKEGEKEGDKESKGKGEKTDQTTNDHLRNRPSFIVETI